MCWSRRTIKVDTLEWQKVNLLEARGGAAVQAVSGRQSRNEVGLQKVAEQSTGQISQTEHWINKSLDLIVRTDRFICFGVVEMIN